MMQGPSNMAATNLYSELPFMPSRSRVATQAGHQPLPSMRSVYLEQPAHNFVGGFSYPVQQSAYTATLAAETLRSMSVSNLLSPTVQLPPLQHTQAPDWWSRQDEQLHQAQTVPPMEPQYHPFGHPYVESALPQDSFGPNRIVPTMLDPTEQMQIYPDNYAVNANVNYAQPSLETAYYDTNRTTSPLSDPIISHTQVPMEPPVTALTPMVPQMSHPPQIEYKLKIRQQPEAARACGFGERDRRVIDPPPILEVTMRPKDSRNGAQLDTQALFAVHCTLATPGYGVDASEMSPDNKTKPPERRLMGTLVSSANWVHDERRKKGWFFVFPDLSCRHPGKYRLKFSLLRVGTHSSVPGTRFPILDECTSQVFVVYTAKDFPGMQASSPLLKALREQGVVVGVKKGSDAVPKRRNRRAKSKSRKKADEADEADEDDEDDEDDEADGDDVDDDKVDDDDDEPTTYEEPARPPATADVGSAEPLGLRRSKRKRN